MARSRPHRRGLLWAGVLGATLLFGFMIVFSPSDPHDVDLPDEAEGRFHVPSGASPRSVADRVRSAVSGTKEGQRKAKSNVIKGPARVLSANSLLVDGREVVLFALYVPTPDAQCFITGQPWPCGQHSLHAMHEIIGHTTSVECSPRGVDPRGRTVASCKANRIDIGAQLLKRGLALANGHLSRSHRVSEARAKTSKSGIWAGEFDRNAFIGY